MEIFSISSSGSDDGGGGSCSDHGSDAPTEADTAESAEEAEAALQPRAAMTGEDEYEEEDSYAADEDSARQSARQRALQQSDSDDSEEDDAAAAAAQAEQEEVPLHVRLAARLVATAIGGSASLANRGVCQMLSPFMCIPVHCARQATKSDKHPPSALQAASSSRPASPLPARPRPAKRAASPSPPPSPARPPPRVRSAGAWRWEWRAQSGEWQPYTGDESVLLEAAVAISGGPSGALEVPHQYTCSLAFVAAIVSQVHAAVLQLVSGFRAGSS